MASHVVHAQGVRRFRFMALVFLFLFVYYHELLSYYVQCAWQAMRASPVVQHDSFEPLLASVAFAGWINMFRVWDKYLPVLHRYRLVSNRVKPDTMVGLDHGMRALVAYLLPLLVFDAVVKRRHLPDTAPSAAGLVGQVVASIFVYDFGFFWVHLALHKWRPLAFLHARHHTKTPMNASEVVRHSLVDGALQVGTNIVTLNLLRSHPMARAVHNVVITYMLTETHSGYAGDRASHAVSRAANVHVIGVRSVRCLSYDMPWMLHNVVPFRLLGGSPRHEAHHRIGTRYYQQFFTYLDNWWLGGDPGESREPFSKRPPDWDALYMSKVS